MCVALQTADQQYQDAFNDELESFKERVRGRAKIRIEKAMKEYEEEERQKRLGPGGLDPVDVYESLPPVSSQGIVCAPPLPPPPPTSTQLTRRDFNCRRCRNVSTRRTFRCFKK